MVVLKKQKSQFCWFNRAPSYSHSQSATSVCRYLTDTVTQAFLGSHYYSLKMGPKAHLLDHLQIKLTVKNYRLNCQ